MDFAFIFFFSSRCRESFYHLLAEGAICPWLAEHPPVRKHGRGTKVTLRSSVVHRARKQGKHEFQWFTGYNRHPSLEPNGEGEAIFDLLDHYLLIFFPPKKYLLNVDAEASQQTNRKGQRATFQPLQKGKEELHKRNSDVNSALRL